MHKMVRPLMKPDNKAVYLLDQIARGYVPRRYRAALQQILMNKHKTFLRAVYFDGLTQAGEKQPIKKAMRALAISRQTLYRSISLYKNIFKHSKVKK